LFGLGVDQQRGSWLPLGGQIEATWDKAVPGPAARQSPGTGRAMPLRRRAIRTPNHSTNKQTIFAPRCIAKWLPGAANAIAAGLITGVIGLRLSGPIRKQKIILQGGKQMRLVHKLAVAAIAAVLIAPAAQAQTFVRMVSGPSGGSWYPLGAKIMQVFQEEIKGISTSNQPGGGISNILAVNGGDAQIGWSYGHTTFNGYTGKGKFTKPNPNVMYFATLYPAMFQVAVRKDSPIKSFADMKAANISPGKAKWTGTAFAESILKAYGISFDSIKKNGGTVHHVDYTESVALMKDKHIDVYMASTSMPQASFIELEQSPGIRFIGLPDDKLKQILKDNPGYIPGVMPKGVYASVDKDIQTLGIVTDMVVSKDLPTDLVYQMCKVFWAHHDDFAQVKKIWNKVTLKHALDGAAIPIHPGAKKCYDELGVHS
jgi:uncharacterized protein